MSSRTGLNRFDMVYYINLEHRKDRLEHISNQLAMTNIDADKIVRIDAVYIPYLGALGCSKSHVKAMEAFLQTPDTVQNCIIFEDDFKFNIPMDEVNALVDRFFNEVKEYDVVMLAYNLNESRPLEHDFLIKIDNAYSTSGYCVNKKFAKTLLDNYREGVQKMEEHVIRTHQSNCAFLIDVYFEKLVRTSKWYGFTPKIGLQVASYSDIEKRHVDYGV